MPGPKPTFPETILGRYPVGTKARIARLLGSDSDGGQAELLREALDRELRRRERAKPKG